MTNEQYREACMKKFDAMSHELGERARVNIETYRKGDHTLRILDGNGAPVVGARVRVTQKDHDFKHGANIFMLDEYEDNEINERYRDQFAKYFNLATVPFYWNATEPEEGKPRYDANSPKLYRRPPTDLCVNYCEEKGILPKIHCLCYDKMIPDWLPKNDSAAMWRLYEKRFAEIAERYEGRMYEVEVTNELISAHKWGDLCSVVANERDVGIKMWQMARKYFSNDKLLSNDTYPKNVGLRMHNDPYYLMLKDWLVQGASIDKIGVQNHIFCGMKGKDRIDYDILKRLDHFDPIIMLRGLDILSEFGKPLEITEVTIPTLGEGEEAEQLQADILRELYTIWFATPKMESVLYWNLPDNAAAVAPDWNENNTRGGLFNYDMTPKKAAYELKRLFTEEWHTDEELVTDENGCVKFRGFFGDYEAVVGRSAFEFGLHRFESTCTTRRLLMK